MPPQRRIGRRAAAGCRTRPASGRTSPRSAASRSRSRPTAEALHPAALLRHDRRRHAAAAPCTLRFADGTTETRRRQLPGLVRQPDRARRTSRSAASRAATRTSGGMDGAHVRDLPRHVDDLGRQRRQDAHQRSSCRRHDQHTGGTTQAYLMALTAETAAATYETFDLSAPDQFPNDKASPHDRRPSSSSDAPSGGRLVPGRRSGQADGHRPGRRLGRRRADPVPDRRRHDQTAIVTRDTATLTVPVDRRARTSSSTARSTASATPEPFKSVAVRIDRSAPDHHAAARHRLRRRRLVRRPGRGQLPRRRRRRLGHREDGVALPAATTDVAAADGRRRRDRPRRHERRRVPLDRHARQRRGRPRRSSSRSTPRRRSPRCTINGAAPAADATPAPVRVVFTRDDGDGHRRGRHRVPRQRRRRGRSTPARSTSRPTAATGSTSAPATALGNVELYQSHTFTGRDPGRSAPQPIAAGRRDATRPTPFAALEEVPSRLLTRSALRNGRFAVRISCQSVEREHGQPDREQGHGQAAQAQEHDARQAHRRVR